MNNMVSTTGGYCYEALLKAIDFFTQRFSVDQIAYYAFEFSNEILTLNGSALFILEDEKYILKHNRLYNNVTINTIEHTNTLADIPILHGNIIINHFDMFFDEQVIKEFNMKLVIPLIINETLYGFIISNGKILDDFSEDDLIIADTLTKLFKSSLENSEHWEELKKKNKELDQKIFNLFAINQSAKSLLYEVDINRLYSLATDVFSEITYSKITAFGIFDDTTKTIKVLGYRNVLTYNSVCTEFYLNTLEYKDWKIVLDFERDIDKIKNIFQNWEDFKLLETKYIILLVKDQILGIVTLSETINSKIYDSSTFELVEALASFTHIAITNALLVKELITSKQRIQNKYNTLSALNKIVHNINTCNNIDEISALTLKTLSINFGIKKAFFAYQTERHDYRISHTLELDLSNHLIILNQQWEKALHGEMIVDFKKDAFKSLFDPTILDQINSSNCLVISPINPSYKQTDLAERKIMPLGFLVILETEDSLKEEDILLIDTITKNILPIIRQMNLYDSITKQYIPDPKIEFRKMIELKLEERKKYGLDFYLYYKLQMENPFNEESFSSEEGIWYYKVGSFLFVISDEPIENALLQSVPYFESIEELEQVDFAHPYN